MDKAHEVNTGENCNVLWFIQIMEYKMGGVCSIDGTDDKYTYTILWLRNLKERNQFWDVYIEG
jgi:hypothetical protein